MGGWVQEIHGRVASIGMAGNPILDSLAEFTPREDLRLVFTLSA